MKKLFHIAASLFLVVVAANGQSDQKEPPPPPKPKVVEEKVKFTPPKVVKGEEAKAKEKPVIIEERINDSKPNELPVITVNGAKAEEFYKRNPGVSDISRKGDVIIIKKKDGTIEKYNMNKKDEDKSFTEKYGVSPIPPPPPPPKKVS